ncbi:5-deoxy-glucuronate isomerase [Petroclostridium sp. X23]|uniref:5-deoxy-glucuronate isomerase n=1 Tax=Petroclostridium sp. X23 TaxID=3045146 RepID=UPI0024AE12D3|nr:5-deoxy-glucuronate isomerase [Petroclostridium sp. X23]WHH61007.1 5-deoxy-glucuronate isomerase [Petroclostridium sp. X23]
MRIRQQGSFNNGYNAITQMNGKHSDMLMDFGILKLDQEQKMISVDDKERAYLLIKGEVIFEWDEHKVTAKRVSCFDENPWCLHVPQNERVTITSVSEDSEIAVQATNNEKSFPAKLYTPEECMSEQRGQGTMKETSTRTVRTIFDKSNTEHANLVLGEVIDHPGKWSSYPPHHHPQPEIYFYKFYPENGFGYAELGEDVVKVRNNDTVTIAEGLTHPQATAPGYAMYYLWVIRHLDSNPYITPTFVEEHTWVMDKEAKIWPDK